MRVSSVWESTQNGHWCSCAVRMARYSRSAAVQYDGPRIAGTVIASSGRAKKSGRYSNIRTMSGASRP